MLVKEYYYNLEELDSEYGIPSISDPFKLATTFKEFLDDLLGATGYPNVITNVSDANVKKLWSAVVSRFYHNAIVRITLPSCAPESFISNTEKLKKYKEWVWRYLALLDQTSPYYLALLSAYDSAASSLMDDITATSKNKVKFNDTPQNANTGDAYEGDNYITNFTSTEGESSSPLMSKIMRLKEIQDHYKNVMADWVQQFEKLFYEVEIHNYE